MAEVSPGSDGRAHDSIEGLAEHLHNRLVQMVSSLKPFPSFMELLTLQAIEIQPDVSLGTDRGCVVLCPDGEFYELTLRLIPGHFDGEVNDYTEELRRLELPHHEFVTFARAAIKEIERLLKEMASHQKP